MQRSGGEVKIIQWLMVTFVNNMSIEQTKKEIVKDWGEKTQHVFDTILFIHNPIEPDKKFGDMLEKQLISLIKEVREEVLIKCKEQAEVPNNLMDIEQGDKIKALYLASVEEIITELNNHV